MSLEAELLLEELLLDPLPDVAVPRLLTVASIRDKTMAKLLQIWLFCFAAELDPELPFELERLLESL